MFGTILPRRRALLIGGAAALALAGGCGRRATRSFVVSARSDGVVEGVRIVGTPRAELHRRFGRPMRQKSIDGRPMELLDGAHLWVGYSPEGVATGAWVDFAEHRRDVGGRLTLRLEHNGRAVLVNRDTAEAEVAAAWPDAERIDLSHLVESMPENYPDNPTRLRIGGAGPLISFGDGKATEVLF